jgi:hypothetical protein
MKLDRTFFLLKNWVTRYPAGITGALLSPFLFVSFFCFVALFCFVVTFAFGGFFWL